MISRALCVAAFSVALAASAATDAGEGRQVTFRASAAGTAPFTYQWMRNGVAIPAATAATYVLPAAKPDDSGTYAVVVANAAGSARAEAVLNVIGLPVISRQPASASVALGTGVTFTVGATAANGPVAYQWRRNGVAIDGATGPTLAIAASTIADAGTYTCQVSSLAGVVTTAPATLAVNVVVPSGAQITITVEAAGPAG